MHRRLSKTGSSRRPDFRLSCIAQEEPRGYDAGKKINGRKRHALVDTDGRGLVLEPHPASIQDRDGGGPLLRSSRRIFPFIQRVFADSGYLGEKVAKATLIAVEIVRKNPDQVGFAVNPRRWVVERSSPGSGAIDGWQRTSKQPLSRHAPSSTPHLSCCSCVGSLALRNCAIAPVHKPMITPSCAIESLHAPPS
jgi:transposase